MERPYPTLTLQGQHAQGLDGAMQAILAQPFGRFLLTAVALGFIVFGLFAVLHDPAQLHQLRAQGRSPPDVCVDGSDH